MNLPLLTIGVIVSGVPVVGAFIHRAKQLSEMQRSYEAVPKKSSETSHRTGSRMQPFPEQKTKIVPTKLVTSTLDGRTAVVHKKWGVDNLNEDEYWYDSRIHTLGNHGFLGALHAALAPVSTKMIDNIAYDGVDIRKRVADELSSKYHKHKAKVLDLCCGVGFSTRALVQAFPDAEKIVGVDTSPEMLAMARFISAHVKHLKPLLDRGQTTLSTKFNSMFVQGKLIQKDAQIICDTSFKKGNAEKTQFKDGSFDVVTIMYAFHEAPKSGRQRILQEVRRVLSPGGVLAIIDIATDYKPSTSMLAGEPYVLEYQKNIHEQLGNQKGFLRARYQTLVPGHVGMWILKRAPVY